MKKSELRKLIREVIKESHLNEQTGPPPGPNNMQYCPALQASNPSMWDYCQSHCEMLNMIGGVPSACSNGTLGCEENIMGFCVPELPPYPTFDYSNSCCEPYETGCPEGMIDDTSPLWPLCIKCYTGSSDDSDITGTPPDCECCRPMDEPEEKLTCYQCKKKYAPGANSMNNQIVAVQFPNTLSSWSWFDFQGECPKGWTEDPDPCKPIHPHGQSLPAHPRNRRRR